MTDLEYIADLLQLDEEDIEALKGGKIEIIFKTSGDIHTFTIE